MNFSPLSKMLNVRKKYPFDIGPDEEDDSQTQDNPYDASVYGESDTSDTAPTESKSNPYDSSVYGESDTNNEDVAPNGMANVTATPVKPKSSLFERYQQATANHPYTDAYAQAVNNPPQEDKYKPNKMTKLSAILSGMAVAMHDPYKGIDLSKQIMDDDYNKAQAEYKSKTGHLKDLANVEQEGFGRDMKGLEFASMDEDRLDKQNERAFNQKEKDRDYELNVRKTAVEEKNAANEANRLKAAGWKEVQDEKGNVSYVNVDTGQIQHFGLMGKSEVNLEKARVAGQLEVEGVRQAGENSRLDKQLTNRQEIAKQNNETKIQSAMTRYQYSPQSKEYNIMRQLSSDPTLADYWTTDSSGKVMPSSPMFSNDATKAAKVRAIIESAYTPVDVGGVGRGNQKPDPLGIRH